MHSLRVVSSVLVIFAIACFAVEIRTYTNKNIIYDMTFYRDTLWVATSSGAVKYSRNGTILDEFTFYDGLIDSVVLSVAVDSSGNTWFGTPKGLSMFNGHTWTAFTTENGLVQREVRTIVVDRDGNIWFGTDGGISRFDKNMWTSFDDFSLVKTVNYLFLDTDGSILAGTKSGCYRYDNESFYKYPNQSTTNNEVQVIARDSSGNLWLGRKYGAVKYNGTLYTNFDTVDGLSGEYVNFIMTDPSGNIWFAEGDFFGTGFGVKRYDGIAFTSYTKYNSGLAGNYVNVMKVDYEGTLWFGTTSGISSFDGTTWRKFFCGPPHNKVRDMATDNDGSIWFATDNGAGRFDGTTWTNYTTHDGLGGFEVRSVAVDRNGNKWFVAGNGSVLGNRSVSMYDNSNWTTYDTNSLPNQTFVSVSIDSSGRKWFATEDGIHILNGTSWMSYNINDGLNSNFIYKILFNRNGAAWVLTNNGGVNTFDGSSWTVYDTSNVFPYIWTKDIACDNDGNLWVALSMGYGIIIRSGSTWTEYDSTDGLVSDNIYAIAFDREGNRWFGSQKGISRSDGKSWVTYDTSDGLLRNSVLEIMTDHDGNAWFLTNGPGVQMILGSSVNVKRNWNSPQCSNASYKCRITGSELIIDYEDFQNNSTGIDFFDMQGKCIRSTVVNARSGKIGLSMAGIARGSYVVSVRSKNYTGCKNILLISQ